MVATTLQPLSTTTRITLNDFMTGFLAALAARHVSVVSIRDTEFYAAVVRTFNELERVADQRNLRLKFWLTQDATHGDAPEVREGITKAVQRDLVSLDNPTYTQMRLKITEADAQRYLNRVPGDADLYLSLADVFMDAYPNYR
ncbi:hypothetical protein [Microbacterium sp. CJ88]|uniref:hypothetical protein n=1 Tax=Microbacterium sp. CJ88 TaxID=3445672 RepID=UPI003F65A3E7